MLTPSGCSAIPLVLVGFPTLPALFTPSLLFLFRQVVVGDNSPTPITIPALVVLVEVPFCSATLADTEEHQIVL